MFTKFKRSTTTLFLDPLSKEQHSFEKGKKIDVILSPALYWVKKMPLPVKSIREVKKLLPSIFEDSLPEGHYSYTAYKSGEEFILFAYEDKKILDLLSQQGVSSAHIASVHFAQSEFSTLKNAFCVNEKQCMYSKEGLLVLAPSAWISAKEKLDLEGLKLSSHTINLQQFGHIVDNSSLYKIGAVLGALVLIVIVEIFIANQKKSEIVMLREEVFSKYKLQSTMFQNRSALSKYTKIHTRQTKLRASIASFLSLRLHKGQKISLIEYKNKSLIVIIDGVTNTNIQALKSQLKAKGIDVMSAPKEKKLKVEVII